MADNKRIPLTGSNETKLNQALAGILLVGMAVEAAVAIVKKVKGKKVKRAISITL